MSISCDSSGDDRYMTNRVFEFTSGSRKNPLGFCDAHLFLALKQGRRCRNLELFSRYIWMASISLSRKSGKVSGMCVNNSTDIFTR